MADPGILRVRIGNPVHGDDFWPRPDIVESLFEDLTRGRGSRRLFALRRIGKTSVMLELKRRLKDEAGLTVVHCDVQGMHRFGDFLAEIFDQLPLAHSRLDAVRQTLAGNTALQSIMSDVWAKMTGKPPQPTSGFVNEFVHRAAWSGDIEAALKAVGPVVMLIDELPFMLRNMMSGDYKALDAERFLATLRGWRMNSDVRMLLSGSIGLAQLRRTERVSVGDHINDVVPVTLPPLPRDEAVHMVGALARGEGFADWTEDLSNAIVDASAETWPIFLQYGFDAVARSRVRDPGGVAAVIETEVRRKLVETFYEQFSTRLARYGADEKPARLVLKTMMASGDAQTSFETVDAALEKHGTLERRDDLLEALREDDFILFDTETQTLRPASRLVPVWVRARPWGR